MEGPKVKKVIDLEDKGKYKEVHPHLPQPPFLLLMAGSVRSGKTNALVGLLRDTEMFGDDYWDITKIYSNSIFNDPKGKYLMDAFDVEDGYKDSYIDSFIKSQKSHDREDMPTALLVFDDIILEYIINNFTEKEEGVRNLKRCLEIIYTKLNLYRLMKPDTTLFVTENMINRDKICFPLKLNEDLFHLYICELNLLLYQRKY